MGIYGIRKPKVINEKTILRFTNKLHIPPEDGFELDTNYLTFLRSLDTAIYKEQIKNHLQPLQALYYQKSGQLESFQINCYAGGFPNLNWDRNNILSTFPPKLQAPLDSIVSLKKQLKFLQPTSFPKEINVPEYDYLVFVYWSKFMGRQNKRFIRFIQQNAQLSEFDKVKIIYINTDNFYANSSLW
tara:strand:- start:2413 stop:2970 length:558 start_codon:yes stop_codon:yes gene_type:complete